MPGDHPAHSLQMCHQSLIQMKRLKPYVPGCRHAMRGHVLEQAELVGLYEKAKK